MRKKRLRRTPVNGERRREKTMADLTDSLEDYTDMLSQRGIKVSVISYYATNTVFTLKNKSSQNKESVSHDYTASDIVDEMSEIN